VTFTFTKSGTTTKFDPDGFGIDNIKLSDGKFVLSYVDETNTLVKYADESDTVGYVEDLVRVSQGVYKATIVPTNALGNVLVSLDSYWSDENGNSGGFTSLDLNAGYTMSIQTALDAISAYADQNFLPYGTDEMRIAIANATSINSSVSAKGYLNGVTISDPGQGLALADVNLLAAAGAKIQGTTDTLLLSAGDLGVSEVPDTVTYEDEDGHPVTVEFFPTLNKIALQSLATYVNAGIDQVKYSEFASTQTILGDDFALLDAIPEAPAGLDDFGNPATIEVDIHGFGTISSYSTMPATLRRRTFPLSMPT